MKTIKVSEAIPTQLDWLVAKCEGYVWAPVVRPSRCFDCRHYEERQGRDEATQYCNHPDMNFRDGSDGDNWSSDYECHKQCPYKTEVQTPVYPPYSTDWAQGGPIIERELLAPEPLLDTNCSLIKWRCRNWKGDGSDYYGPTYLIAAMRCYVTSKMGETVEVPEELT